MTTMLYKCPGPHAIHGGQFDYIVVDDDQVDATLEDGWHLTTSQAKQAHEDSPTRAELEQMAGKLGISFSPRTSDKKLRAQIEAAAAPDVVVTDPVPAAPATETAAAPVDHQQV